MDIDNSIINLRTKVFNKHNLITFGIMTLAAAILLSVLFSGLFFQVQIKHNASSYIGFSIAVFVVFFSLYLLIYSVFPNFFNKLRSIILIYTAVVLSVILNTAIIEYISPYAAPLALASLLVCVLLNRRLGFYVNTATIIVLFLSRRLLAATHDVANFSYAILVIGFFVGIITVVATGKRNRRSQYLKLGLGIGVLSAVVYLAFAYINNDFLDLSQYVNLGLMGVVGGIVNIFLLLGLLPAFEKAFNVITSFRLAELADHDMPLLKRLAAEAPGTFNHSQIVANLAESCASAIGENSYLARVCAYYHDVGKIKSPNNFKENQKSGENPHDELPPEVSVGFIKKHVANGVAVATEYKLPEEVVDAIREHHGTLPIKVFYFKALKYTDGELDISEYSYEGPTPTSKISAIIMIADGAEAAIRSMTKPTYAEMEEVVRKLIKERLDLGQFTNCNITMRDLNIIHNTILTTFTALFHERIEYPKEDLPIKNGN